MAKLPSLSFTRPGAGWTHHLLNPLLRALARGGRQHLALNLLHVVPNGWKCCCRTFYRFKCFFLLIPTYGCSGCYLILPYGCSGSTILEHESLSSSYKEQKRAVRKHILRSLLGASPFTICNGCFNLVQMPSDMYVSKSKIAKIQCGQCSKVLVLSFPATHGGDANISQELTKKPKKPGQNKVANKEDAVSYSAVCPGGDPVGLNEECSASFSRSFSSRARPAGGASGSGKNVSDSALHRLMGYDSASQLLRHSRVFDDGYDSFESMVPVSNRVSRRKNL